MAYCECDNFIKDTGSHSENSRIVNFDIIYKQARGEEIHPDLLKKYKTIDSSRIDQQPDTEKTKALSSAFRSPKKDIFLKKGVINSHFKQDKRHQK